MELSLKDLKELFSAPSLPASASHPFKIGQGYLMRTVTMIIVGKLEAVHEHEFLFSQAAWVADTDRFYDCLMTGKPKEVEPFPNGLCIVGRGSLVDCADWNHEFLKSQK